MENISSRFQDFWNWLPSDRILSSWAIIISFISIFLSFLQSIKDRNGKILVNLYPIYITVDDTDSERIRQGIYQAAEVSITNYFKKAKHIKRIELLFPKKNSVQNHIVWQGQIKISPGAIVKIPVTIKPEYYDFFRIYGFQYRHHQIRAVAVDTLNKRWISKAGLTAGNLNLIGNRRRIDYSNHDDLNYFR